MCWKCSLEHFSQKTKRNESYKLKDRRVSGFNSLLATASIEAAKKYYATFKELQKDFQDIETDKFFALCGLLFDGDLQIEFPKKAERVTLTTTTSTISLPKIKIEPALKIK